MSISRDQANRNELIRHMYDEEAKSILLEEIQKAKRTPELQNALNKYLAGIDLEDDEDAIITKFKDIVKILLRTSELTEKSRRNPNGTTNVKTAYKAYNALGRGRFDKQ